LLSSAPDSIRDDAEALLALFDRAHADGAGEGTPWADLLTFAAVPESADDPGGGPRFERLLRIARQSDGKVRATSERLSNSDLVLGRYRILERVGQGGMGEVFRARDIQLERDVALKYLASDLARDEEAVQRFVSEARIASSLDHPHIGYIHEVGRDEEGRWFIAMAYYAGQTLRQRIAEGPIDQADIRRIAVAMADALANAHSAGIVHRDVNPGNVILTQDGGIRLIDFGVATIHDGQDNAKTEAGTAAYMSPEHVAGQPAGPASDVWAFGVTLFEMMTGRRPFEGAYDAALRYEIVHAPIPSIADQDPGSDADLRELVDRCLVRVPAERIADGSELCEILRNEVVRAELAQTITVRRRRVRTYVLGAMTGVAAIVLAAMLLVSGRDAPPPYLAVLPFTVLGANGDEAIVSAGMLETLTSRLSQMHRIDSRIWVVAARDANMTPDQAREEFGAEIVVTGSMQYAGERVRLTINLIDTRTRRIIDSELVDSGPSSTMALQDEAALAVARMLRLHIGAAESRAIVAESSVDPEANRLYVRGRGFLSNQQSLQDVEVAIAHFERAIEIDPAFVNGHAALGEALWQKYRLTEDVAWAELAVSQIEHALILGDGSGPALVTLGMIQSAQGDQERALATLDRAVERDPFDPEALRRRAGVLRRVGRSADAEADLLRIVERQPDFWAAHNSLAVFYLQEGRYDDAIGAYERGLAVAPANTTMLVNLAAGYWELGRLEEAIKRFERVLALRPDHAVARANLATLYYYSERFEEAAVIYGDEVRTRPADYSLLGYLADTYWWIPARRSEAAARYSEALAAAEPHLAVRPNDVDLLGALAWYHARLGDREAALENLRRIENLVQPDEADGLTAFGIGEVYETLGMRDDALRWMTSALDRQRGMMQLRRSPWLRELRSDERLAEYMRSE
jgi:tetratricopeptide (TPR) repeat protein/TolB-like protein/predicted Ser/Thr protein kinase